MRWSNKNYTRTALFKRFPCQMLFISCLWYVSMLSENIRKPQVFRGYIQVLVAWSGLIVLNKVNILFIVFIVNFEYVLYWTRCTYCLVSFLLTLSMFCLMSNMCKPVPRLLWGIFCSKKTYPAGIYIFKVNNRSTRTRRERCLKLTIEALEQDVKYV